MNRLEGGGALRLIASVLENKTIRIDYSMASSIMRKNDTHSNTQSLSSKRIYDRGSISYTQGDFLLELEVSEESNNRPMADMADDIDDK
jgi:hypothetical protein